MRPFQPEPEVLPSLSEIEVRSTRPAQEVRASRPRSGLASPALRLEVRPHAQGSHAQGSQGERETLSPAAEPGNKSALSPFFQNFFFRSQYEGRAKAKAGSRESSLSGSERKLQKSANPKSMHSLFSPSFKQRLEKEVRLRAEWHERNLQYYGKRIADKERAERARAEEQLLQQQQQKLQTLAQKVARFFSDEYQKRVSQLLGRNYELAQVWEPMNGSMERFVDRYTFELFQFALSERVKRKPYATSELAQLEANVKFWELFSKKLLDTLSYKCDSDELREIVAQSHAEVARRFCASVKLFSTIRDLFHGKEQILTIMATVAHKSGLSRCKDLRETMLQFEDVATQEIVSDLFCGNIEEVKEHIAKCELSLTLVEMSDIKRALWEQLQKVSVQLGQRTALGIVYQFERLRASLFREQFRIEVFNRNQIHNAFVRKNYLIYANGELDQVTSTYFLNNVLDYCEYRVDQDTIFQRWRSVVESVEFMSELFEDVIAYVPSSVEKIDFYIIHIAAMFYYLNKQLTFFQKQLALLIEKMNITSKRFLAYVHTLLSQPVCVFSIYDLMRYSMKHSESDDEP